MPFHYGGGHGGDESAGTATAANELTITDWDPVSKQPHVKFAAVWVQKA
jgi:ferredoxin-nitrate reductase